MGRWKITRIIILVNGYVGTLAIYDRGDGIVELPACQAGDSGGSTRHGRQFFKEQNQIGQWFPSLYEGWTLNKL